MSGDEALQIIVLAAGGATRFGAPKQLARLDGQPLLRLALSRAQEVGGQAVSVVLGAHAARIAPMLAHSSASVIVNRGWQEGIASSIRAGLERVSPACRGALLMLADQVHVSTVELNRLVSLWRRQPLYAVAAHYRGTSGVPAIFPRSAFAELLALRGDRGAQGWLRAHPDRVLRQAMPSAAFDIDTPADLLRAADEVVLSPSD